MKHLLLLLVTLYCLTGCTTRSVQVNVNGHNGPITVQVTSHHGVIESIDYYDHQETVEVCQKAANAMIDDIITHQTLNVDIASGATVTCQAILNGVEKALLQLGFNRSELYQSIDNTDNQVKANEETYDVLIVGAGGAGLSAAVMAAREGVKVAVLEKMSEPGGNTVRATAMYNCVDNELQHPLGIYDSEEDFFKETFNGGHQLAKPELVRILTSQADEGKQFLEELGLKFDTVIDNCLGGAIARGHYSLAHNGTDYIQVLWQACKELGVDFFFNTSATELMCDLDNVVGVKAISKGKTIEFHANNGVVLATGGFAQNVEMRMYYNRELTGEMLCSNAPGANGDGIIMASKIGASLINMEYIELYPMGDAYDGGLRNSIPNAINQGILVNQLGQRFIREDGARDELSEAILNQSGSYAYSIVDDDYAVFDDDRSYLEGLVLMGYVEKANSIEELATLINIDPNALISTINQYNYAVSCGNDVLHRETLINAIDNPPYYANMKKPTIHHTLGGVEINELAQVLNQDKQPISGLFAAGEVTGGIHGANRLGGNSYPDIIVFGRIAGKNAALNQQK